MARYKLMVKENEGSEEYEVGGQRKSTKGEIERWVSDNINSCGLDWRSGYMIKFRDSFHIYIWRWIKNDTEVTN
ncbi:MAG: hypothetical protein QM500_17735 [Methylococcales bacterium]